MLDSKLLLYCVFLFSIFTDIKLQATYISLNFFPLTIISENTAKKQQKYERVVSVLNQS